MIIALSICTCYTMSYTNLSGISTTASGIITSRQRAFPLRVLSATPLENVHLLESFKDPAYQ